MGWHFGDDFDADKLGNGIASNLGGDQNRLECDSCERDTFVGAGSERFAKGVHAEVRAKCSRDAVRRDARVFDEAIGFSTVVHSKSWQRLAYLSGQIHCR